MTELPTTQRAYTLQLQGPTPDDKTWREMLWRTHAAVNRGAKVFGDWLLTLRGGLCHTLADASISVGNGKPDRKPTEAERRHRRIILALSWLSVEDSNGAPNDKSLIVVDGTDSTDSRERKLIDALAAILLARGVNASVIGDSNKPLDDQPGTWLGACVSSLSATIRDDAVWVNRSRAFDAAMRRVGPSLTRTEIWDILGRFFKSQDAYFGPCAAAATAGEIDEPNDDSRSEAAGAKSDKPNDRELAKEANGWLRDRFGTGTGADFGSKAREYSAFASWCRSVTTERRPVELIADLKISLGVETLPQRLAATSGKSNSVQLAYQEVVAELQSGNPPSRTDWDRLASLADDRATEKMSRIGKKGRREWTQTLLF
jgi:hypothetical protein